MHPDSLLLSDYVDGDLTPVARAEIGRHLSDCDLCRTLVGELEGVKKAAAALGSMDPPARVWARVSEVRSAERLDPWIFKSATWPLATAAALLLATVIGLRLGQSAGLVRSGPPVETPGASSADLDPISDAEFQRAETDYQTAIHDLEQIEGAARDSLDPQTADDLQTNLAVIDAAIGESRVALAAEPWSEVAQHSLLESLKTKVSLLQTTTGLVNATARNRG